MQQKRPLILIALLLLSTTYLLQAQQFYNVLKYGARNDSSAKATLAIKKAIDAAVKSGGGTVYFPAGKYLTGPIHLKSNITVYIDAGATLYFSDNFDDYLPMVESRYEGVDVFSFSPLFYAYKAENIAITGRGKIVGNGKKWWDFVEGYKADQPRSKWQYIFDSLNKNILLPDDPKQMKRGFLRPPFIQPMYCNNILIQGITIENSPFWTINPQFCNNVTIHAVTVLNPQRNAPNTDGINPESCSNVRISDCHISVGDDCITIKSGKDIPGRTKNRPAENYTITNCTMLSGHGGVVIGSEMSGGVKKIVISNCIFDGTDRGIRLKTTRGRGGVVEDIRIDNIIMKNIRDQGIVMDMEYAKVPAEPVSDRTPVFRNIKISNVSIFAGQAMFINGLEEMPVTGISINDAYFESQRGITINNGRDIELHNIRINTTTESPLTIQKSSRIDIDGVTTERLAEKLSSNRPMIRLVDAKDILVRNCWLFKDITSFIEAKTTPEAEVKLVNNITGNASIIFSN